jgi:hypothetical protein
MTKFKITRGVEMREFLEKLLESTSLFLKVPEFWKPQPETASPFPWSAGFMKNTLNQNIVLHCHMRI